MTRLLLHGSKNAELFYPQCPRSSCSYIRLSICTVSGAPTWHHAIGRFDRSKACLAVGSDVQVGTYVVWRGRKPSIIYGMPMPVVYANASLASVHRRFERTCS